MARLSITRTTLLSAIATVQLTSCGTAYDAALNQNAQGDARPLDGRTTPPAVLPQENEPIAITNAVAINDAMAFTAPVGPPARPFAAVSGEDGERAVSCLTAAVYYEAAGEGVEGERAVAQVVLNRVRHPAFPNTICAVVFQGAERPTGCQFTFACDGSLRRVPSVTGWANARQVADAALRGWVDPTVGHATHYHANYVVPVWSAQMDKVARVGLHIFYRWKGAWGTAKAFGQPYGRTERAIASIAGLAPSHATIPPEQLQSAGAASDLPTSVKTMKLLESFAADAEPDRDRVFLVAIPTADLPEDVALIARKACAPFKRCAYFGWVEPTRVAASRTLTASQRDALSFSYERDDRLRRERVQWDCRLYRDQDRRSCLIRPLLVDLQRDQAGS